MSSSLESKSVYIHQFGALPLEIVDLIHSFSTRESSAALRLVCVRFSQGHRWRRCRLLATASDVEASQVSRVLRSASLTRLSLANCRVLSSAKVEQILSGTHRLTRLDLCGLAVERELFWRLPSLVPYLRDLNAGLVQTTDAQPWTMGDFCHLQALTALERLDLPMWRDISFLADGFAALRSIACRSMSALDDAAETRAVLPGLTQLTHISLARSGPVFDDFAQSIRTLRKLEFVDVRSTTISDAGVRLLLEVFCETLTGLVCNSCRGLLRPFAHVQSASELPRLERVEFDECSLTPGHWMVLAQLTSLRRLNANSCSLGDYRVLQLRALTRLEHLELASNSVSDAVLVRGLCDLRRLEKVNLMHNFVSDAGVEAMARSWPFVRELNLFGNDEVTERGLFMLGHALPDARVIVPFHLDRRQS
jgi:hypothetical protein